MQLILALLLLLPGLLYANCALPEGFYAVHLSSADESSITDNCFSWNPLAHSGKMVGPHGDGSYDNQSTVMDITGDIRWHPSGQREGPDFGPGELGATYRNAWTEPITGFDGHIFSMRLNSMVVEVVESGIHWALGVVSNGHVWIGDPTYWPGMPDRGTFRPTFAWLTVFGDVSIPVQGSGISMHDVDGNGCHRLRINDNGTLRIEKINCDLIAGKP